MKLIRASAAALVLVSFQSLAWAQLPPGETTKKQVPEPAKKQVAPVYSAEEASNVIRLQSEAILELQRRLQALESRISVLEAQRPRSDATAKGGK